MSAGAQLASAINRPQFGAGSAGSVVPKDVVVAQHVTLDALPTVDGPDASSVGSSAAASLSGNEAIAIASPIRCIPCSPKRLRKATISEASNGRACENSWQPMKNCK